MRIEDHLMICTLVIGGEEDDHVCDLLPYRKWKHSFLLFFPPSVNCYYDEMRMRFLVIINDRYLVL